MTTNPPPDARNARIYVATANVAVMDILSGGEQSGAAGAAGAGLRSGGGSARCALKSRQTLASHTAGLSNQWLGQPTDSSWYVAVS